MAFLQDFSRIDKSRTGSVVHGEVATFWQKWLPVVVVASHVIRVCVIATAATSLHVDLFSFIIRLICPTLMTCYVSLFLQI